MAFEDSDDDSHRSIESVEEGLLKGNRDSDELIADYGFEKQRQIRPLKWTLIHSLLIFIYTLGFGSAVIKARNARDHAPGLVYSPARAATHLESVRFSSQLGHQTRYSGPPRPEVDAAWDELLQNTNIRVSATDLRRIDRNSIPLADGSGDYMAGLDVYHQLHCVKYLRHYLYAEYYNTSGAGEPSVAEHVDHCLDSLRQVVMCGADVSLITYDWLDNYAAPYPNFDVVHQCRSFEAVDKWANQHALDVFDGTSLVHPVFGPAFARDEDGQPVKSELMHEHGVHSFGKVITPVLDGVQATRDSE